MARNEQIAVRITPEVKERMQRIADEEGESLSGLTWRALCGWLDQYEDQDSPSGRASLAASAVDRVLWEEELLERAGIHVGILEVASDELNRAAMALLELEVEDEEEEDEDQEEPSRAPWPF